MTDTITFEEFKECRCVACKGWNDRICTDSEGHLLENNAKECYEVYKELMEVKK